MYHGMSDSLVNKILLSAALVAFASALALLYANIFYVSMVVDFVSAVFLGLLLLFRKRIPTPVKLTLMAITGLVIAITAIFQNPYAPDGYLVIGGVMALSFTNWSGRRALLIPGLAVLGLLVLSVAIGLGWIDLRYELSKGQSTPQAWFIVAVTMVLLSIAVGGAIYELKNRLFSQIRMLESANAKLFSYAYRDELTGLSNKNHLEEQVNEDLAAHRAGRLIVLDLTGFGLLHALHGHARGDRVLADLSALLRELLGNHILLAKLPDFQLALWASPAAIDSPEAVFERIRTQVEARLALDKLGIGVSAGWASGPEHGMCFEALMKNVHVALSPASGQGGNRCVAFTPVMEKQMVEERRLKDSIRHALDQDGFYAVYQAKVRSASHEVVGFEGLARMKAQDGGPAPGPGVFIPVLHAEGWMNEFGMRMLHTIIHDIPAITAKFGPQVKVAANVSPPLFLSHGFAESLGSVLLQAQVLPGNLIVEITEEVFANNADKIMAVCSQLRALGVQISLDDFGSGFSSLGYLRSMQFDEIKIDKSFVDRIESDEKGFLLFSTMCKLGLDLQCRVVVEGVETQAQLDKIETTSCDLIQGYLFSRPQPLELF